MDSMQLVFLFLENKLNILFKPIFLNLFGYNKFLF